MKHGHTRQREQPWNWQKTNAIMELLLGIVKKWLRAEIQRMQPCISFEMSVVRWSPGTELKMQNRSALVPSLGTLQCNRCALCEGAPAKTFDLPLFVNVVSELCRARGDYCNTFSKC